MPGSLLQKVRGRLHKCITWPHEMIQALPAQEQKRSIRLFLRLVEQFVASHAYEDFLRRYILTRGPGQEAPILTSPVLWSEQFSKQALRIADVMSYCIEYLTREQTPWARKCLVSAEGRQLGIANHGWQDASRIKLCCHSPAVEATRCVSLHYPGRSPRH